jgi:peroxiredoxin
MPSLNEFQRRLAGSDVVVLGISVDRNDRAYKNFLKRANIGFQTARDPEANVSSSYGTFKYPETYVVNSKGEVVEKFIGPQDWTDPTIVNRVKSSL